jgi:hypothetical protein
MLLVDLYTYLQAHSISYPLYEGFFFFFQNTVEFPCNLIMNFHYGFEMQTFRGRFEFGEGKIAGVRSGK